MGSAEGEGAQPYALKELDQLPSPGLERVKDEHHRASRGEGADPPGRAAAQPLKRVPSAPLTGELNPIGEIGDDHREAPPRDELRCRGAVACEQAGHRCLPAKLQGSARSLSSVTLRSAPVALMFDPRQLCLSLQVSVEMLKGVWIALDATAFEAIASGPEERRPSARHRIEERSAASVIWARVKEREVERKLSDELVGFSSIFISPNEPLGEREGGLIVDATQPICTALEEALHEGEAEELRVGRARRGELDEVEPPGAPPGWLQRGKMSEELCLCDLEDRSKVGPLREGGEEQPEARSLCSLPLSRGPRLLSGLLQSG